MYLLTIHNYLQNSDRSHKSSALLLKPIPSLDVQPPLRQNVCWCFVTALLLVSFTVGLLFHFSLPFMVFYSRSECSVSSLVSFVTGSQQCDNELIWRYTLRAGCAWLLCAPVFAQCTVGRTPSLYVVCANIFHT